MAGRCTKYFSASSSTGVLIWRSVSTYGLCNQKTSHSGVTLARATRQLLDGRLCQTVAKCLVYFCIFPSCLLQRFASLRFMSYSMQLDVTVALIDFKVLTVDTDQRPACRREPATNISVTQCSDKVNASVWVPKRATKKAYWKYTFVWIKGKHTKQNWLDGMGIVRMLQLSLAIIDLSHKSVPVEIHNNLI